MSKKYCDQENVPHLDKEKKQCRLIMKPVEWNNNSWYFSSFKFSVDPIIERVKYHCGSRDNKIMYQYLPCIFEEKPNKLKLYLMYPSSVPKEQYLGKCLTEGWLHILLERFPRNDSAYCMFIAQSTLQLPWSSRTTPEGSRENHLVSIICSQQMTLHQRHWNRH